jgi:hypothetical protein
VIALPWDGGGGAQPGLLDVACIVAAPAYPIVVFAIGASRNLFRETGASKGTIPAGGGGVGAATRKFLGTQLLLDEVHVVAWDVAGLLFKGLLTLGLCLRR